MRIYIPTYRRVAMQETAKAVIATGRKPTFVCDATDGARLGNLFHSSCEILIHPAEIDTIAKKRAWIIQQAEEDKILMLDDDLRFAVRRGVAAALPQHAWKLEAASASDINTHLIDMSKCLDEYAHAGWSARQGNNRKDAGWQGPGRMMYVLGYRPQILREQCELGRIETREDFDYTLQLLRKGFPNLVQSDICADQRYNAKGGCSEQRTMEASNADAYKLAELHPGLVKPVEKAYESSIPRVEVTVQWKKALEEGVAAHGLRRV